MGGGYQWRASASGHWSLVIHWTLKIGQWSFPPYEVSRRHPDRAEAADRHRRNRIRPAALRAGARENPLQRHLRRADQRNRGREGAGQVPPASAQQRGHRHGAGSWRRRDQREARRPSSPLAQGGAGLQGPRGHTSKRFPHQPGWSRPSASIPSSPRTAARIRRTSMPRRARFRLCGTTRAGAKQNAKLGIGESIVILGTGGGAGPSTCRNGRAHHRRGPRPQLVLQMGATHDQRTRCQPRRGSPQDRRRSGCGCGHENTGIADLIRASLRNDRGARP